MGKFRVKEVALNEDGTDIWFYPELLVVDKKVSGYLWWKKLIDEEWQRFYNLTRYKMPFTFSKKEADNFCLEDKKTIIAFRTLEEANAWYTKHVTDLRNDVKKRNEELYKFVGGQVDTDKVKIHELNLD